MYSLLGVLGFLLMRKSAWSRRTGWECQRFCPN